ncbi:MAG TPA: hypothetical protein DCK98_14050 [Chloroflexi bacterium]|nr:hypothetical protein [Chloroflexota bacterium]HAL25292.1 hypothetical protein [Chloroflexota bacterium]
MNGPDRSLTVIRHWLIGLVGGVIALAVTDIIFPLGIAMVVGIALLRPRPVAAGGACVAWGAGFAGALWLASERCAEFNRQPNAGCTMGDNTPFLTVGLAVLVLGLLLTSYAAARARSSRF